MDLSILAEFTTQPVEKWPLWWPEADPDSVRFWLYTTPYRHPIPKATWRERVHPCALCGILTHRSREVCTICRKKPEYLDYLKNRPTDETAIVPVM